MWFYIQTPIAISNKVFDGNMYDENNATSISTEENKLKTLGKIFISKLENVY